MLTDRCVVQRVSLNCNVQIDRRASGMEGRSDTSSRLHETGRITLQQKQLRMCMLRVRPVDRG